jgi:hypothetical protein
MVGFILGCVCRCGNVAAILELDENLNKQFRVFDAAPQVCTYNTLAIHYQIKIGVFSCLVQMAAYTFI